MIDTGELRLLEEALETLSSGFADLPSVDPGLDADALRPVLEEVATRMHDNYPYPHPLYAGQMLKPPHPVARIAYALSLWINPNNHALDGGRASSAMEKECVADIAAMFGWEQPLGHLTSGGTMANLEALWVADQLHPGKRILGSDQAHYTHSRISRVLKIQFESVVSDPSGAMNIEALQQAVKKGDVGTVVVTMGTTGLGAVDPLPEILELAREYGFRVHADAAYGGYFSLCDALDPEVQQRFAALNGVDSIVIDPHKHGLQPYGCGCVLFEDATVGRFYKHDSAYTYFSSDELHLGEISLECSRAGSSAVALWATHRLLPPVRGGEFAESLGDCRRAALAFVHAIRENDDYAMLHEPMLDIVVYSSIGDDAETVSKKNQQIFHEAARRNLHLALIEMPAEFVARSLPLRTPAKGSVSCLRSVLMKPAHVGWIDDIVGILNDLAAG